MARGAIYGAPTIALILRWLYLFRQVPNRGFQIGRGAYFDMATAGPSAGADDRVTLYRYRAVGGRIAAHYIDRQGSFAQVVHFGRADFDMPECGRCRTE